MDESRVAGTVRNVGSKVEEAFGRITGDLKTQAEGPVNQAAGAAQDLHSQARGGAADAVGAAKDTAATVPEQSRLATTWANGVEPEKIVCVVEMAQKYRRSSS